MRQKKPRLIVTFETTAMALKMEKICHAAGAPGRLIPVPREITAGCGMAWMAEPEELEQLQAVMRAGNVTPQGIHVLEGKSNENSV